jgi:hypothetical protein
MDSLLTLVIATVVMISAIFGSPVSTTHVVSSSIMGIGASERVRAVRWQKAKEIVAAGLVYHDPGCRSDCQPHLLPRQIDGWNILRTN